MVNLQQLRDYMNTMAEQDRKVKSVRISGKTLEDALTQASIELGVPLVDLEYEILQSGSSGAFGVGRQDFIITAYKSLKMLEFEPQTGGEDVSFPGHNKSKNKGVKDKDGEVFLKFTHNGVMLKSTKAIGKGKRVTEKDAIHILKSRQVGNYDSNMVAKVIKRADSQYVKVADFTYNPANDSVITIDIRDMDMKAFITIMPPGPGGIDLTSESITMFLKNNGIFFGIKEEEIANIEQYPVYNEPILIAEGLKEQRGNDAKIIYNFEVDSSKLHLKEKNGKVDFKELNLVQNVVEGQALAKKIPFTQGIPGRTVTGKVIPAKSGKDISLGVGKNVRVSEDGTTLIASTNGQVIILNNKVNVETINVVPGDVNLRTGNIMFLGTVIVKGNVDDGFSVKAAGNIEVLGNVGKCTLDAEGEIIVHQGINAKNGGNITAGKGVWAKFIQNSIVDSGTLVVVSDGIINSKVNANQKIICKGKRATIVGGHLRASQEINAKTLGSIAGSETILEVGYDPKKKERLAELEEKNENLRKEMDEVELNIGTLEKFKKVKKELPEEKENYLRELIVKKNELTDSIDLVAGEMTELQSYLASISVKGKIGAAGRVYSGVKIVIKEAVLDVRNEFKAVTFINEAGLVKVTKYIKDENDSAYKR